MFSTREIKLVRDTWAPVARDPDDAATRFYGRLFDLAPEVKPLFQGDLHEQGRKLMHMVGIAIKNLDHFESILPMLRELGVRHKAFGATPAHFPLVGSVLISTLSETLGDAFTDEARSAWGKVYDSIAAAMLG